METELNKIDILINKAKVTSISFKIKDNEMPEVEVGVDLLTATGTRVVSIALATDAWNNNSKLNKDEIPGAVYSAAGQALKALKEVCIRKINSINSLLEA